LRREAVFLLLLGEDATGQYLLILLFGEGEMVFEGVKLLAIGIGTVMSFLVLMICCINLIAYLTRGVAARELETIRRDRELLDAGRKKAQRAAIDTHLDDDIVVIAAAVAAFEGERMVRS
jgi:Na+-transporting methylmalonyl-CoA/oxaloacetate decarboxylase gamma subunit